jgi:RNA recognition motif-containing protein
MEDSSSSQQLGHLANIQQQPSNGSYGIETESPLTSDPSSGETQNNNESKKIKLALNPPSRVVHIRNIPSDVNETEIVHLGIPFGRVSNVLVLKGKNQAFLEMGDESAAVAMVSYFNTCAAQLRGRSVYVQYSTHRELKTDQSHSNANSAAQVSSCFHVYRAIVVTWTRWRGTFERSEGRARQGEIFDVF